MTNTKSNAFDSKIKSIILKSSTSSYQLDIILRNKECQFIRLEMEESVFNIYPSGCVLVRDTKDIVSIIQTNKIDTIDIILVSGATRSCSLTSTSYINNAASDNEENMVALNISNHIYRLSQQHSASYFLTETDQLQDQVYTINELASALDKKLSEHLGGQIGQYIGRITPADNYFCLKMLSAGNNKLNYSVTDNAFQCLNYLSTLAVGKPESNTNTSNNKVEREPRYLFWTVFDDKFYFKYFPTEIAKESQEVIDNYERNNFRYAVYTGDTPSQRGTNDKTYKKIYVFTSDPTNQYVSKNYFYIRKTPKFLDSLPASIRSITDEESLAEETRLYTTKALSYHFQDDGEKYNIEAIASSGIINGVTSGSDEFFCETDWGWAYDFNTSSKYTKSAHNSGEYGMARSYSDINYMGSTGYFSKTDNVETWKNIFDATEIHPDYPRNGNNGNTPVLTKNFYYNIIQKNLNDLYKEQSFIPNNLELLRKIERENFVLFSLCCIQQSEESFFASLIRYEPDPFTSIPEINGAGLKWRYKWEGLKFTNGAGSTYWTAVELWESDPTNMAEGATANDTWAINLNERTAGLGSPQYYPPGWVSTGLGSFMYRPIGCNTSSPNPTGATIAHIVKMYKVTAERLSSEGGIPVPNELRGKNLYYFSAENVVDGVC